MKWLVMLVLLGPLGCSAPGGYAPVSEPAAEETTADEPAGEEPAAEIQPATEDVGGSDE